MIVLRYRPEAEAVEARTSSDESISFAPLETSKPIPTIQIGSDFYQLAPTPEPSETPEATVLDGSDLLQSGSPLPQTTIAPKTNSVEYQVPDGAATGNSYGFTLAPTAPPPPSPPPLDVSVEDDQ